MERNLNELTCCCSEARQLHLLEGIAFLMIRKYHNSPRTSVFVIPDDCGDMNKCVHERYLENTVINYYGNRIVVSALYPSKMSNFRFSVKLSFRNQYIGERESYKRDY